MATKAQYEFFKLLFDEETTRYKDLIDRGKTYISLLTLYGAFLAFSIKDAAPEGRLLWLFVALIVLFLAAFALAVTALNIQSYEGINEPDDVVSELPQRNAAFFDARIVDFSVASERNSKLNDRRATFLRLSGLFLLLGLVSHSVYFAAFAYVHNSGGVRVEQRGRETREAQPGG